MISYWKLDETSGNVYTDEAGTNNATSSDMPAPVTGRVEGGQQFNGTSNQLTVPSDAIYDFMANSSFTFETWIKHPAGSFSGNEIIIGRKAANSKLSIWLGFGPTTNINFSVRSTTGESRTVTGPSLYDDNWHHIAAVKDGSLNQLRIYVDGALSNTAAASYTSGFDSPNTALSIGWRNITGDESFFEGLIDEVAVYNSVLDETSITQHYNNGLQNKGYCQIASGSMAAAPDHVSYTQQVASENQPTEYKLFQNYPNPFNPSTRIKFAVPASSLVLVQIFNQLGEIISQPVNNYYEPGIYETEVDMSNYSSGIYFYRINAGAFNTVKKMILIK
jgi:hypothetical protein